MLIPAWYVSNGQLLALFSKVRQTPRTTIRAILGTIQNARAWHSESLHQAEN